jgi:1-aminocyclopropane-1-carboxylate deaminase
MVAAGFGIGFKESWENALEEVRASGGIPYPIPAGASDHRLGGLGFANWADEVHQQEQQLGVHFDTIIVCTVTGSTHAGMIAGFAGQDRPRRGSVSTRRQGSRRTRAQVEDRPQHSALIGLDRDLRDDEINVLRAGPVRRMASRSPRPWTPCG